MTELADKGTAKLVKRRSVANPKETTAKTALPGSADEESKSKAVVSRKAAMDTARLAQIVNLHIGGFTLEQIALAVGTTADEIDRLLATQTARYVRSQPALRIYVRNWVSERYAKLLEAVWDEATDKNHREKLENSAQALRILDRMVRLHGAEAPVQTEVKVESAPEAVEKLVAALSSAQGLGYDASVFDVIDVDVIEDAVEQTHEALEESSEFLETDEGDEPL